MDFAKILSTISYIIMQRSAEHSTLPHIHTSTNSHAVIILSTHTPSPPSLTRAKVRTRRTHCPLHTLPSGHTLHHHIRDYYSRLCTRCLRDTAVAASSRSHDCYCYTVRSSHQPGPWHGVDASSFRGGARGRHHRGWLLVDRAFLRDILVEGCGGDVVDRSGWWWGI